MIKNTFSMVSLLVLFAGCSGSPVHTSSKSPQELKLVDDYTLCKAATPRELYSPKMHVLFEVQRRGLSCGGIYTWKGTPVLDSTINALQNIQNSTAAPSPSRPMASYTRQVISGLNKICFYQRLGSEEAYNFKTTEICPLTLP